MPFATWSESVRVAEAGRPREMMGRSPEPEEALGEPPGTEALPRTTKVGVALLVLVDFVRVSLGLRRHGLVELVERLSRTPRLRVRYLEPRRLGRIVGRVLRVGRPYGPRCIINSLVLYRMLRRQGTERELVIGLPPAPTSHEAHAWIEVDGREVGPPPGRMGHTELARYSGPAAGDDCRA